MDEQRWIQEVEAWCDKALAGVGKDKYFCTHVDEFEIHGNDMPIDIQKNKIFFDFSIKAYKYFSCIERIDKEKYKPKLIIPLTDKRSLQRNLCPPSRAEILSQMSYSPPLFYLIERSMDMLLFNCEEYSISLAGNEWIEFGHNYKIVYKVWRSEEYLRDGLKDFSRQVEIDYYPDLLIG